MLRDLQRPLKQRYKEDPGQAMIPAHASATIDIDGVTCRVTTSSTVVVAGLHPAAGGTGAFACSADMLLEGLVACAGVTLAAVASAMSVVITAGRIVADGHWDARGTLGVDREAPVGMTDITVRFELVTDADAETVARLIDLTERYCVIAQTLAAPPAVGFSHSTLPSAS